MKFKSKLTFLNIVIIFLFHQCNEISCDDSSADINSRLKFIGYPGPLLATSAYANNNYKFDDEIMDTSAQPSGGPSDSELLLNEYRSILINELQSEYDFEFCLIFKYLMDNLYTKLDAADFPGNSMDQSLKRIYYQINDLPHKDYLIKYFDLSQRLRDPYFDQMYVEKSLKICRNYTSDFSEINKRTPKRINMSASHFHSWGGKRFVTPPNLKIGVSPLNPGANPWNGRR